MSLIRTAVRGSLLRTSLEAVPAAIQCRFTRDIPDADMHFPFQDQIFTRMYGQEIMPMSTSNPTRMPTSRRFGMVMCQSGYLSEKNLNALQILLKRQLGAERFISNVNCDIQVYKKSAGKRMGGGKGKKAYKVMFVKPNDLLFEWDHPDRIMVEKYAKQMRYLCALRMKLVMHGLPTFERLQEKLKYKDKVSLEEFKDARKLLLEKEIKKNLKPTGPFTFNALPPVDQTARFRD